MQSTSMSNRWMQRGSPISQLLGLSSPFNQLDLVKHGKSTQRQIIGTHLGVFDMSKGRYELECPELAPLKKFVPRYVLFTEQTFLRWFLFQSNKKPIERTRWTWMETKIRYTVSREILKIFTGSRRHFRCLSMSFPLFVFWGQNENLATS